MLKGRNEQGRLWLAEQEGATAVEYAIMASLIAVVIVAAVILIGNATRDNVCAPVTGWGEVDDSVDTGEC